MDFSLTHKSMLKNNHHVVKTFSIKSHVQIYAVKMTSKFLLWKENQTFNDLTIDSCTFVEIHGLSYMINIFVSQSGIDRLTTTVFK